ncbi:hypothetical protein ABIE24_001552 [Mycetocola sp. 2940]
MGRIRWNGGRAPQPAALMSRALRAWRPSHAARHFRIPRSNGWARATTQPSGSGDCCGNCDQHGGVNDALAWRTAARVARRSPGKPMEPPLRPGSLGVGLRGSVVNRDDHDWRQERQTHQQSCGSSPDWNEEDSADPDKKNCREDQKNACRWSSIPATVGPQRDLSRACGSGLQNSRTGRGSQPGGNEEYAQHNGQENLRSKSRGGADVAPTVREPSTRWPGVAQSGPSLDGPLPGP